MTSAPTTIRRLLPPPERRSCAGVAIALGAIAVAAIGLVAERGGLIDRGWVPGSMLLLLGFAGLALPAHRAGAFALSLSGLYGALSTRLDWSSVGLHDALWLALGPAAIGVRSFLSSRPASRAQRRWLLVSVVMGAACLALVIVEESVAPTEDWGVALAALAAVAMSTGALFVLAHEPHPDATTPPGARLGWAALVGDVAGGMLLPAIGLSWGVGWGRSGLQAWRGPIGVIDSQWARTFSYSALVAALAMVAANSDLDAPIPLRRRVAALLAAVAFGVTGFLSVRWFVQVVDIAQREGGVAASEGAYLAVAASLAGFLAAATLFVRGRPRPVASAASPSA